MHGEHNVKKNKPLVGNPERKKYHLLDLVTDGRIIKRIEGKIWRHGSGQEQVSCFCDSVTNPPVLQKAMNFTISF